MLAIGKMNPESISVGSRETTAASWKATCCVSATVEINRPSACALTRNSERASSSTTHDPRIGSPNSTIAATMIAIAETSEMMKYGIVLPAMNLVAASGAMRICSIVPRSFSPTTDSAVEITAEIIAM